MLFLDDGVFQLLGEQQPTQVQQKNLGANLQALPMFGVDELFVSSSDLAARGLSESSLALPAQPLGDAELSALVDRFDQVITL